MSRLRIHFRALRSRLMRLYGRSLYGALLLVVFASLAVPADEVEAVAEQIATELAQGHQSAIRWTKRALNGWLRLGQPAYDSSVAYAMLGMHQPANEKERDKFKGESKAIA